MAIGQTGAVHFVGDQGADFHRLLEWDGVRVIIHSMQAHFHGLSERPCLVEEIAQGNSFPDCITHEPGIEAVTNAHQGRLLFHGRHGL